MATQAVRAIAQAGCDDRAMFTTQMAAQVLGVSDGQLHRMEIAPDGSYQNEYNIECPLYSRETVLALYDDPRVVRARARRTGKRDWDAIFSEEYQSRDPIPDAADVMNRLTHYASNAGTSSRQRIRSLKERFVHFLWERDCGIAVWRATRSEACWRCDGEGCERCQDGWRIRQTGKLAFAFEVAGRCYVWELRRASWLPDEAIGEEIPVDAVTVEEPSIGFAKAYALLEWTVAVWRDPGARG